MDIRNKAIDTDQYILCYFRLWYSKGVVTYRSVIDFVDNLSNVLSFNGYSIWPASTLICRCCLKEIYSTLKWSDEYLYQRNYLCSIKLVDFMNEYKINTVCWVVSALTIFQALEPLASA